jgi:hypothetical protein
MKMKQCVRKKKELEKKKRNEVLFYSNKHKYMSISQQSDFTTGPLKMKIKQCVRKKKEF